jgi:hypothetical protein
MAFTNAEKQAELPRARAEKRKRPIGIYIVTPSCALSSFSTPAPGAQLKRTACHKGCSVTSLIKEWAASAERADHSCQARPRSGITARNSCHNSR